MEPLPRIELGTAGLQPAVLCHLTTGAYLVRLKGFEPSRPKAPASQTGVSTISPQPHNWYRRRESNPHALGQRDLNPPCLPFHHSGIQLFRNLVPKEGVEPSRPKTLGFESSASTVPPLRQKCIVRRLSRQAEECMPRLRPHVLCGGPSTNWWA